MSSFDLAEIKQIDTNIVFIVFGYVREQQENHSVYCIPDLISFIILHYFYECPEYFNVYPSEIEEDRATNTILNKSKGDHCAYGNVDIKSSDIAMIYEWTFKLKYFGGTTFIGIDSSGRKHLCGDFTSKWENDSQFYAFSGDHQYDQKNGDTKIFFNYYHEWETGDILKMVLNVKNKSLKIYREEQKLGNYLKFMNVDLKDKTFNLAVQLWCKDESVQLLNFKQYIGGDRKEGEIE